MSYNSGEYFNSNEFKAILRTFEHAEKAGVPILLNSEELIDIAEYYYNKGNIPQANEIADRTIELYPGASAPLLFKARTALQNNNDVKKAKYYAELIADKTDIEYYYIKAEIMIASGFPDKADLYLEDCMLFVDEEDNEFFPIDIAEIFLDYGQIELAEAWLKRSGETDSTEYKEQYARIMLAKGDFETSKDLYNELIDEDPYSTQYWNALASSLFMNKDIEGAIRCSEYAIAINPDDPAARLNKANALYKLGNYTEAIVYYKKFCELCPNDETGEMFIGYSYILLEDYTNAVKHLKKAAEIAPQNSNNLTDIYKELAFALCCLGKEDECFSALDEAEKMSNEPNQMLVYRGSMLQKLGHIDEANDCFAQAIDNSKGSSDILMKVAITIFERKDVFSAYKIFKFLYERDKDWNDGYAYYAACCFDLKLTDKFLSALQKAVEYTPEETKNVLGMLFPPETEVKDYYRYMYNKIRQNKR